MRIRPRRARTVPAILLLVSALVTCTLIILPAASPTDAAPTAITYVVNSPADVPDVNPGNGVCETGPGNGICTLRAAVQETNKHPTTSVTIRLQPGMTYLLTRPGIDNTALNGDLDITGTVTIEGAGPDSTIIDGTQIDRVFEVTGTIVISGVTVQHGKTTANDGVGAGIYSKGPLTVTNSHVISNTALELTAYGGGIYGVMTTTVQNSLIAGNIVSGAGGAYGGGIFSASYLVLQDSTVAHNRSSLEGGGIIAGSGVIRNSTIRNNIAMDGGGMNIKSVKVVNSTISGNFANRNGGGIWSNGVIDLFNVTVANNTANDDSAGSGTGGGIYMSGSAANIANSIIAGNSNGTGGLLNPDDCSGTITSLGYNIVQVVDATHCTMLGEYGTGDPMLAPLQFNGGSTQTHALMPGSAAINAGNPGGCTDPLGAPLITDQRGKPRPVFGSATRCDLGAFEVVWELFLPLLRR